jgi:hypothetical protein
VSAPAILGPARPPADAARPPGRRTAGQEAEARHAAWLRALEGAAFPSWFRGDALPAGGATALVSRSGPLVGAGAPTPAQRADLPPDPAASPAPSTLAAAGAPRADHLPGAPAVDQGAQGSAPPPLTAPQPPALAALGPGVARACARVLGSSSPARAARPGQTFAPEPEPVRVHAEWAADGVRVWLGVDERAASIPGGVAPLVRELRRRVEATGARLSSVVLNGRVLYGGGTSEPPRLPEEVP